jgi:hypothetical protein
MNIDDSGFPFALCKVTRLENAARVAAAVWRTVRDPNELRRGAAARRLTQLIALHSKPPKAGPALSYSVGG